MDSTAQLLDPRKAASTGREIRWIRSKGLPPELLNTARGRVRKLTLFILITSILLAPLFLLFGDKILAMAPSPSPRSR